MLRHLCPRGPFNHPFCAFEVQPSQINPISPRRVPGPTCLSVLNFNVTWVGNVEGRVFWVATQGQSEVLCPGSEHVVSEIVGKVAPLGTSGLQDKGVVGDSQFYKELSAAHDHVQMVMCVKQAQAKGPQMVDQRFLPQSRFDCSKRTFDQSPGLLVV